MLLHEWISLVLICVMGAMSPGPSLVVILACTVDGGKSSGIVASLGHGLGVFLYAGATATGLGLLLIASPTAIGILQFLGACFLLRIGWKLFFSVLGSSAPKTETDDIAPLTHRFRDGFLIAILNPKIAIFFLSVFSQFLNEGQSSIVHMQMAITAGIIDSFIYVCVVMMVSNRLVNQLLMGHNRQRNLIIGGFLMLIALGLVAKQLYGLTP